MGKYKDDAYLAEITGALWGLIRRIDVTIRAGGLPQPIIEALVSAKVALIDVGRNFQIALEKAEQDSDDTQR